MLVERPPSHSLYAFVKYAKYTESYAHEIFKCLYHIMFQESIKSDCGTFPSVWLDVRANVDALMKYAKLRQCYAHINHIRITLCYRKASRAIVVLFPLLGLTYVLMLVEPPPGHSLYAFVKYGNATLSSLQGLLIALIYCFFNGEVRPE